MLHLTEETKLASDYELSIFSINSEAIDLHDHTFYEFFVVIENIATHFYNGKTEKLPTGTLVLMRPGDFHAFIKDPDNDSKIMNLIISHQSLSHLFGFLNMNNENNLLINSTEPKAVHLNHNQLSMLLNKLNDLNEHLNSSEDTQTIDSYSIEVKKIAFDLLQILLTNKNTISYNSSKKESYFPSWFNKLLRNVNKDNNFIQGMDYIYQSTTSSPSQICKAFKKYLGQTPTEYINHLKLSHAVFLLKTTNDSIISIAYDSGFNNISHFNHQFKKAYLTTPNQYRNTLKINQRETPSD